MTVRNFVFFILCLGRFECYFFGLYQSWSLIFLFLLSLLCFFFILLHFLKNYFFSVHCIILLRRFFVQLFDCFRGQRCSLLVLFYRRCCFSALSLWLLFRITGNSLLILPLWIRFLIYTPFICFVFLLFFILFIIVQLDLKPSFVHQFASSNILRFLRHLELNLRKFFSCCLGLFFLRLLLVFFFDLFVFQTFGVVIIFPLSIIILIIFVFILYFLISPSSFN